MSALVFKLTVAKVYMLLAFLALAVGFAGGFFVGLKNANSSKVEKAKDIINSFKK